MGATRMGLGVTGAAIYASRNLPEGHVRASRNLPGGPMSAPAAIYPGGHVRARRDLPGGGMSTPAATYPVVRMSAPAAIYRGRGEGRPLRNASRGAAVAAIYE